MNIHAQYAKQYGCSIAQAIHDRDWPLNRSECIEAFKEAAGRAPTEDEIKEMRPDSDRRTQELRDEFAADYASVYG